MGLGHHLSQDLFWFKDLVEAAAAGAEVLAQLVRVVVAHNYNSNGYL